MPATHPGYYEEGPYILSVRNVSQRVEMSGRNNTIPSADTYTRARIKIAGERSTRHQTSTRLPVT